MSTTGNKFKMEYIASGNKHTYLVKFDLDIIRKAEAALKYIVAAPRFMHLDPFIVEEIGEFETKLRDPDTNRVTKVYNSDIVLALPEYFMEMFDSFNVAKCIEVIEMNRYIPCYYE